MSSTRLREGLEATRVLIEKGWTRRALARNAAGWDVGTKDPEACSWCVVGATIRATGSLESGLVILNMLRERVGGSLSSWNDAPDRTQGEVLALFDEAIASLPEEG